MQLPLQTPRHENGSTMRIPAWAPDTYTCSRAIRPPALLAYEHMFPRGPRSKLAQRALGALGLARSFLLLEDDYVDWEVGQDEPSAPTHPHRAPLRGRGTSQRRRGTPAPRPPACLTPTEFGIRVGDGPAAGSRGAPRRALPCSGAHSQGDDRCGLA